MKTRLCQFLPTLLSVSLSGFPNSLKVTLVHLTLISPLRNTPLRYESLKIRSVEAFPHSINIPKRVSLLKANISFEVHYFLYYFCPLFSSVPPPDIQRLRARLPKVLLPGLYS